MSKAPTPEQVLQEFIDLMDTNCDWPDTSLVTLGQIARRAREAMESREPQPVVNKPARREFLALAEACGAVITGKPDGSEPVNVVFSPKAWQAFDHAVSDKNGPSLSTQDKLLAILNEPTAGNKPLRELRLWHWRQAALYGVHAYDTSRPETQLMACKYLHSIHLHAVQTLNEFFPIGDTAERDDVQG